MLRERPAAMVARVWAEAERVMPAGEAARVRDAVHAALVRRDAAVEDDHDPRCLMPGRVVRILIADAACRDADVLCAAAFVDTIDPHLVGDIGVLGASAARLRAAVPEPDEDLLERLVTVERDAAIIAVAERLDQARHLHMRPDLPWAAVHAQIRAVYVPVAVRVAPRLAQRLQRWADAFQRRRLKGGPRGPRTCEGTGQATL